MFSPLGAPGRFIGGGRCGGSGFLSLLSLVSLVSLVSIVMPACKRKKEKALAIRKARQCSR